MAQRMSVVVPGKPMTWSRARTGRHGQFFTPADRDSRMRVVSLFWLGEGHERIEKPAAVAVRAEFVFDRPDGHYGTGRNRGVLKERFRFVRPGRGKMGGDLDNLVKLMLDALNHVAYADDSQISDLHAVKRYVDPEKAETAHTRLTLMALDNGESLPEVDPEPAQLALA